MTHEQRQEEADVLYNRVQAVPATLQLATTPLLSTIIVLIWRKEGVLPKRRVELYEHCCHVLIEHWEKAHNVSSQGELADMDWKDHFRLLMPIAYAIHGQEQRTSATRDELIPFITRTLQTIGYADEQVATRVAKQFLTTLGLRSGLLQYIGDDRYGFPHQTFQEYLVACYIAAQPDPEYIDLVMAHLHETWWKEVHLLTIGLLGSESPLRAQEAEANTKKASALILTILHAYKPPSWIWRSSAHRWIRMLGTGKYLPWLQLERRIAWLLAREFELVARGYVECAPNVETPDVDAALSARAVSLVWDIIHDSDCFRAQKNLLTAIGLLQRQRENKAVANVLLESLYDKDWRVQQAAATSVGELGTGGNEEVVRALLVALHDKDWGVQQAAATSLGKLGAGGNEEVVRALLGALHDKFWGVQQAAARSLGQLEIRSEIQRKQVLMAFNRLLPDSSVCEVVLAASRQLLDGYSLPGYRWVSLLERRTQRLRLKRIAFLLGLVAILLLIAVGSTWFLGYLNPNGFALRALSVLAAVVAFAAAITQIRGWSLRDPWERR